MRNHRHSFLLPGRPPSARLGRVLPAALSLVLALASLTALMVSTAPPARAATLPAGFQETTVFSGLELLTAVRFAPDGRVLVAEKRGVIKVFDSLTDTTPTTFADLNVNVHNFWDRGLLGLALAPNFPGDPYVYVLYTYDAAIGGSAPRWGTPGVYADPCPSPPCPTADGCVVSGRLSRLQASGNTMTGAEQVLVEDWCQQYPSHSVGAVEFGADGALYASGGDGASFNFVDYGQDGSPVNPCGDPPGGVGSALTPRPLKGARCEARTCAPPATRSVWTAPSSVSTRHRFGAGEQPARGQCRPERQADHRVRPAQSVPLHDPPGHQRAVAWRCRLERLGGDQPHRQPDRLHR